MSEKIMTVSSLEGQQVEGSYPAQQLGDAFMHALARRDFDGMQNLFAPAVRFRAMVPSGERMGQTAGEAAGWFKRWFGSYDTLQIVQSTAEPVFNRFYLCYRLRLHHPTDGWKAIEQHAYCDVQAGQIGDMWLLCSGFCPERELTQEQGVQPHLGGNSFYDAGAKGCADGPIDEISARLRSLAPGQTLEVYATNPSVAGDLPAWCRLSGHALVKHEGDFYLIQHQ